MQRLRITIEIDTDMTREQFNNYVRNCVPTWAARGGELVYLATDYPEPPAIMHDTTELPVGYKLPMSQRLR